MTDDKDLYSGLIGLQYKMSTRRWINKATPLAKRVLTAARGNVREVSGELLEEKH